MFTIRLKDDISDSYNFYTCGLISEVRFFLNMYAYSFLSLSDNSTLHTITIYCATSNKTLSPQDFLKEYC